MVEQLNELWRLFNDPARLPGAMDSLTTLAGLVGLALTLLLLMTGVKSHALRWVAVLVYAGAAYLFYTGASPAQGVILRFGPAAVNALAALALTLTAIKHDGWKAMGAVAALVLAIGLSGVPGFFIDRIARQQAEQTTPGDAEQGEDAADGEEPGDGSPGQDSIFDFGRGG